eukprot:3462827-Rhodomonas_salina.1
MGLHSCVPHSRRERDRNPDPITVTVAGSLRTTDSEGSDRIQSDPPILSPATQPGLDEGGTGFPGYDHTGPGYIIKLNGATAGGTVG